MKIKVIKRREAEEKGLKFFYSGKMCKWGHKTVRFTSHGENYWRQQFKSKNIKSGLCYECILQMDKNGGVLGDSFDDIMKSWKPDTDSQTTKYLPILSGTKKMGYKVVGETLIDTDWYKDCSKYLWTFVDKSYVNMCLSKDNMKRRGLLPLKGKSKYIRLHRYVMGISNEVLLHVDHINGDTQDNRLTNLRLATQSQNEQNKVVTGFVKYKGVSVHKGQVENPFRVQVYRNGKTQFTKNFSSSESAAKYYDDCLRTHYPSEFNTYNFPLEGERSALK